MNLGYGRQENGVVEYYHEVPAHFDTGNGILLGLHQSSDERKAEFGFYPVVSPEEYNPQTHKRTTELIPVEGEQKYTYKVVERTFTLEELIAQKINELDANMRIAQEAGWEYEGDTFALTPERKQDVADFNMMIKEESSVSDMNEDYEIQFTEAMLTTTNGHQAVIQLEEWTYFFLQYGKAFGQLKLAYAQKKAAIISANSAEALNQISTEL